MIKHIKKKFFVLCMTTLLGVELLGTPVSIKAAENVDLTETSETVQSGEQIALTATNFPDANFRASIKAQYDKDGDGYINVAEVTKLNCSYRGVKSLKGIEKFRNLAELHAEGNDISGNVNLKDMKKLGQVYIDNPVNYTYDLTGTYFEHYKNGYDGYYTFEVYVKKDKEVVDLSHFIGIAPKMLQKYTGSKEKHESDKYVSYWGKKYTATLEYNVGNDVVDGGWTDRVGSVQIHELKDCETRVAVGYKTHVQSYGWNNWSFNGTTSGTTGKRKRLEGICLAVNQDPIFDDNNALKNKMDLGVQYTTHVQSYGWQPWVSEGEMSGTEGEAKRLEAIKIQLTGRDAAMYDIYYRVHAQSYGWLGWAKNGEPAGTAGYAKRLEAIQIKIVKKGTSFNRNQDGIVDSAKAAYYSKTGEKNVTVPGSDVPTVMYQTHVQTYGWQSWKKNGETAGTVGKAKRLEGIKIKLSNTGNCYGGILYKTHVQTYGWEKGYTIANDVSGTVGKAKRLEAIEIKLYGDMADQYDVYYRVHAQTYGWLGWSKNGAPAGTEGLGKRLEGIQIVLVKKGNPAPANNYKGVVSGRTNGFIKK